MKERSTLSLKAVDANTPLHSSLYCFEGVLNNSSGNFCAEKLAVTHNFEQPGCPGPGDLGGPGEHGEHSQAARPAGPGCPSLDTILHKVSTLRKPFVTASDRRRFSRCMLGLMLPGRYYFLTLTSSPESPKLEKSWCALRFWLKRYRSGITWLYCFTDEGHGVIHMVVRLGMKQKRIVQADLKKAWKRIHQAEYVWVARVKDSKKQGLANYIADQRKLRKMGSEMSWQPGVTKWRWSKGWIPSGFTRSFGRFWQDFNNNWPDVVRDTELRSWIQKCAISPGAINNRPHSVIVNGVREVRR